MGTQNIMYIPIYESVSTTYLHTEIKLNKNCSVARMCYIFVGLFLFPKSIICTAVDVKIRRKGLEGKG